MSPLSAEYALVTACLRADPADVHAVGAVDAALARSPAWNEVLRLAEWHQVAPLVFQTLRAAEFEGRVPRDVIAELRPAWDIAVIRNLRLQGGLIAITDGLAAADIDVLLLKGAALMETVYRNPGQRSMGDLDLLVPEADLGRAVGVVQGLGYESQGDMATDPGDRCHAPALVGHDRTTVVELHRHLRDRATFSLDGMWSRARTSDRPGRRFRLPSPEDLVMHLCAHFAGDRVSGSRVALRQLTDIAETIRQAGTEFDWSRLATITDEAGFGVAVFLGLAAVDVVIDATLVPDDVLEGRRPARISAAEIDYFIDRRVLRADQWLHLDTITGGRNRWSALFPRRRPAGMSALGYYRSRLGIAGRLVALRVAQPRNAARERALNGLLGS